MLGQVWARASPWCADRDAGATRPAEGSGQRSCSGFASACKRAHTLLSRSERARRWRGRLCVVPSGKPPRRVGALAYGRKRERGLVRVLPFSDRRGTLCLGGVTARQREELALRHPPRVGSRSSGRDGGADHAVLRPPFPGGKRNPRSLTGVEL